MKVDTNSVIHEIISEEMVKPVENSRPKNISESSEATAPEIESDEDSGIMNVSNNSIDTCTDNRKNEASTLGDAARTPKNPIKEPEVPSWRLHIPPKMQSISERDILDLEKSLFGELDSIPENIKKKWVFDKVKKTFDAVLPDTMIDLITAHVFSGDTEISMDIKPGWLDMDKFNRGQKFVADYNFSVTYAEMISLFTVFTFEDGLKPLIATGASGTPYTSFKRYLSTNLRMQNWYSSDPWTQGTPAYNDIKSVRKIHALVRKRMEEMNEDELERKTTINNPWCPKLDISRQDFQSTCPAPASGQCPYMIYNKLTNFRQKKLSQGEMSVTQFAFVGLVVTYPKFFGVHYAAEEDLESFAHVWRCIGYLLGIDDDFNFCRGTLADVRTRSKDFLNYWVKPNLRNIQPEWEHMMRCVIEGVQYYFPGSTYETSLLDLATVMDLHMPRLYNSLSYPTWIKHCIVRFYFNQGSKMSSLRSIMNRGLLLALDKAKKYDEKKHKDLQERSDKTLTAYAIQLEKSNITSVPYLE